MKAIIALVAFTFLFYFSFVKSSFAVSVGIFSYPDIITDDLFTLIASISGASTGTNYLRIDLFKDGTTNYFGETYNSSDWYSGSDGLQYFSIPVVKGSTASATIQGRVGNPSPIDFIGNGVYKLRVRRYTTSGAAGTKDVMTPVDITINLPPTPTPTATPTPSPTPTPTPTKTPSPTPTPIPTKIIVGFEDEFATESEILGTSSAQPSASLETPNPQVKTLATSENILQKVFIILSFLAIITSAGIFVKQKWIK